MTLEGNSYNTVLHLKCKIPQKKYLLHATRKEKSSSSFFNLCWLFSVNNDHTYFWLCITLSSCYFKQDCHQRISEMKFKPLVADLLTISGLKRVSKTASAPTIPLFMALWTPLIFGTLRNPELQPIKQPPGNVSLGMLCKI